MHLATRPSASVACADGPQSRVREDDVLPGIKHASAHLPIQSVPQRTRPTLTVIHNREILELKEIMKSLPKAPSSSYRPPFSSTCIPSQNQPFPISRFATAPSLTPSRWKNRDDSASSVDPEILPYLDSVPIRLLPLLPPSAEPSQPGTPSESSQSTATTATPAEPTQPLVAAPTLPSIKAPSNVPVPILTPPSTPMPDALQTPTKRRPNFAFVPLLPVQEERKVVSEPPVAAPPTPTKRFNMTFVPLLPPEEPSKPTAPSTPPAPSIPDAPHELTPQNETPPEEDHHHPEQEPEFISSPPPTYMPLNFTRSYSSTPSLCSASDTESETPSVNSPCPSSPAESDHALTHYFDALDADAHRHAVSMAANHNPYFPAIAVGSSLASHMLAEAGATKLKLEALPSPALQPPSPFCLDPPAADGLKEDGASDGVPTVRGSPSRTGGAFAKRAFIARPSSLSSLSSLAQGQEALDAVSESLSALALVGTPTASPALETPELTIEAMRAPSYVRVPNTWRAVPAAVDGEQILEPSIRRREL